MFSTLSTRNLTWLVNGLLVLSIVLAIWVVGKRLHAIHISSTVGAGTAITSGCEEESIFALWRISRSEKVYLPKNSPPYAATYFNWAFYRTYGAFTKPLWKLGNEPNTIFWARVLTAFVALSGAGLSTYGFGRVLGGSAPRALPLAIACFVFTGPLIGWWLVTIRPDICALVAEAASAWLFLRYNKSHPTQTSFATAIGLYIAWSFKPTCVAGLVSICLFLFFQRRWAQLSRISITTISLWAFTLVIGGADYRSSILDTATNNVFYFSLGLSNFFAALKAGVPLLVLIAAVLASKKVPASATECGSLAHDAAQLGLIGTFVTTTLMLVASSKLGATPNYFFSAFFMASLWAVGLLAQKAWIFPSLGFALMTIVLQLGLVLGAWGSLDLTNQNAMLAHRWSSFQRQPEPRFSADLRLNYPWLNPSSPPLMPAYNYASDRNRGVAFKSGGIGGMIETGRFTTLLLPTSTTTTFDHASLDNFTRGEVIEDYAVYSLRK
jgi:hypothetical protein